MASTQISFALRTTANVKSVHLIGSWDCYQGHIPLSRDKSSKSGTWRGTFRFQTSVLAPGKRYWFYYMLDGYQVSHDPSREFTTEPTTGRKLNVLNVPAGGKIEKEPSDSAVASNRRSRRHSRPIPQGRGLSPSLIQCPKPQRPAQTKQLISAGDYHHQATLAALNARFAAQKLSDSEDDSESEESECESEFEEDSDGDSSFSDVPSLASSASSRSSSTSVSSNCSCNRYGITRGGERVKIDCGGARCGGSSDESCVESSSEDEAYHARSTRRYGVVIR